MLILRGLKTIFCDLLILLPIPLYRVSIIVLNVFFALTQVTVFDNDKLQSLISNIYIIMGVIMLFTIAFSLLKAMVNDEETKKSSSTIKKSLINIVTSTIILILLPTIFSFAMDFQKAVIVDYNVVGNIFEFGTEEKNASSSSDPHKASKSMVNSIYTAFFNVKTCNSSQEDCDDLYKKYPKCVYDDNTQVDDLFFEDCQESMKSNSGKDFKTVMNTVNESGVLEAYTAFGGLWADGYMKYDFLLCLICGFLLIYIMASFAIDMAIRFVKLVFYQIIAPIPVFLRVVPNEKFNKTFNTWVKVTLTCYLEVFIRLIVVYFVIYMSILFDNEGLFKIMYSGGLFGWAEFLICKALLFVGLFTFMKQAPKLLSEVTGLDSSNMKLGIKDKLAEGGLFAAGATVGSFATAGVRNVANSFKGFRNKWENGNAADRVKLLGKSILRVPSSLIAGTVGGGVRGYVAGKNAKSFKEMSKAAETGATGVVNARDKRAAYKARHGGNIGGVIKGKISDNFDNFKSWAGVNNYQELVDYQNYMSSIMDKRKKIDNEAFDLIDGDLAKMKDSVSYDLNSSMTSNGKSYDMMTLRAKKAAVDAAIQSGNSVAIDQANKDFAEYRKNWADELKNIALRGQNNWKSISYQADKKNSNGVVIGKFNTEEFFKDLGKIRIASDAYREDLSEHVTMPFMSNLSQQSRDDLVDIKNKDLSIKHDMLDRIKVVVGNEQTDVIKKINEFNKKQEDKSSK